MSANRMMVMILIILNYFMLLPCITLFECGRK